MYKVSRSFLVPPKYPHVLILLEFSVYLGLGRGSVPPGSGERVLLRTSWDLCLVYMTLSHSDMHSAPSKPKFQLTVSPAEALLVWGCFSYLSGVLGQAGKPRWEALISSATFPHLLGFMSQ